MLSIRDLAVRFQTRRGPVDALRGVDLDLARGETLGVVGESGSGKSVTAYSILRLLESGGQIVDGSISYSGIDLTGATDRQMADMRGREISMIFQNPRAALNPIRRVGDQIADVLRRHGRATRQTARQEAIKALEAVRIRDAEARVDAYPFELSGGMCQRVVIALALACDPKLLIMDEPTTGLDITTQKAVMDLVAELIRDRDMSAILITHDLGLASLYCDRILVMKDGEVVERGMPEGIFAAPEHPYTRRLIDATPRLGARIRELLPREARTPEPVRQVSSENLLEVTDLVKTFAGKSGPVHAVRGVSFSLKRGQTLGLVGESGCGKSTTSSMIVRLLDPTSGRIVFDGEDLATSPARAFARDPRRARIQMVFQDATDSLNPRHTSRQSIGEPLKRLGGGIPRGRIEELAELVGLPLPLLDRFPHQLSGGQKARVGIARAIAVDPALLILDEPTAALDVSIQALVLNLLIDLQARLGMSYLFVSHDLNVVRLLCDEVIVMQAGQIVEQGRAEQVMRKPATDYTRTLIAAAPQPPEVSRQEMGAA